jgi:hypothetical protein
MAIRVLFTRTNPVEIAQLCREIQAAHAIEGVSNMVRAQQTVGVDFVTAPLQAEIDAVQALVTAHVAIDPVKQTYQGAQAAAAAIPNWSSWTAAQANAWGQTNIGTPLTNARTNLEGMATLNLTTFKVAMRALLDILDAMWTLQMAFGQMIIALRNKTWPGLENGIVGPPSMTTIK